MAGDLVGKGPTPRAVVERLAGLDAPTVRGNVDRRISQVDADEGGGMPAWTAAQLTSPQRASLEALPEQLELEIAGWDILLVHGSPLSDTDFVFPSITERALDGKLKGRAPAVLVCGHSHLPFQRQIGDVLVVNCGSAGLPYDGDPRPSYVMLDLDRDGGRKATVHRFEYDIDATVEALERSGLPDSLASLYRTGTLTGIEHP